MKSFLLVALALVGLGLASPRVVHEGPNTLLIPNQDGFLEIIFHYPEAARVAAGQAVFDELQRLSIEKLLSYIPYQIVHFIENELAHIDATFQRVVDNALEDAENSKLSLNTVGEFYNGILEAVEGVAADETHPTVAGKVRELCDDLLGKWNSLSEKTRLRIQLIIARFTIPGGLVEKEHMAEEYTNEFGSHVISKKDREELLHEIASLFPELGVFVASPLFHAFENFLVKNEFHVIEIGN